MSVRGPSPRRLARVEPPDAFDDGGDFLRGGLQRTRFEHKEVDVHRHIGHHHIGSERSSSRACAVANIGADRVTAASSPSGYLALMQRRQDPVQAPRLRLLFGMYPRGNRPRWNPSLFASSESVIGRTSMRVLEHANARQASQRAAPGSCLRTAATVSEEPRQSSACNSVGRRS